MTEIGIVIEHLPKCSAEREPLLAEMSFDIALCPDIQNLSTMKYEDDRR